MVDKFVSTRDYNAGKGRQPFYPLNVVYFVRNSESNLRRILDDYKLSPEAVEKPDCFERCFPFLFRSLTLPVNPPRYGDARTLFVAGKRSHDGPPNWRRAYAYLQTQAETNPEFSRFTEYWSPDLPVKDCLMEFMTLDSHMFSLEMHNALSTLYSKECIIARDAEEMAVAREYLDLVAYRLSTVCIALNEHPHIRAAAYRDDDGNRLGAGYTSELAVLLESHLSAYKHEHPEWLPVGSTVGTGDNLDDRNGAPPEPATLLIVDRVADIAPALAHSMSYEAMLVDVLDATPGQAFHLDNAGKEEELLLTDADPVYAALRSESFFTATRRLEAATQAAIDFERDSTTASTGLAEMAMRAALIAGPEFNGLKVKIRQHQQLQAQVTHAIGREGYADMIRLQQELLTHVDDTGADVSATALRSAVKQMLGRPFMDNVLSTRLLCLYFLTQPSLDLAERRELMAMARLDDSERHALSNLPNIGVPLIRRSTEPSPLGAPSLSKREAKAAAKAQAADELCRYEAKVVRAVRDAVTGTLDELQFPFVRMPEAQFAPGSYERRVKASGGRQRNRSRLDNARQSVFLGSALRGLSFAAMEASGSSRRAKQSKFGGRAGSSAGAAAASPAETAAPAADGMDPNMNPAARIVSEVLQPPSSGVRGGRVIVFVLGGISISEITALQRVSRELKRELVFGGTSVLAQTDFIGQLYRTEPREEDDPHKGAAAGEGAQAD